MGNVRPEKIKRIARELLRRYPNKFTTNFEENKKILSSIALVPSSRLRNSVAGYITRLVVISQAQSSGSSSPLSKSRGRVE
ncbi:MAG: 30S ribosomal protein S17e [Candidatus Bathyarchaeia archaeon]|nr:30S ribosomal protein S17e [Candidatus Bathyarchaeota archaeon]